MNRIILNLALLVAAGAAVAQQPLAVEVTEARRAPFGVVYELSGSVEAAESLQVGFRSGGRITVLNAGMGDSVKAGDTLAEVDHTQAAESERGARAQLAAAEAGLKQAEQARDRASALADRGAGTRASVDAAEEAVLASLSARDQAAAQVKKAEQALRDTYLIAPADGIVTERTTEIGQIVGAAQAVLVLARDDRRVAVFNVPDIAGLDDMIGMEVPLRAIGASGAEWQARVSEISPLATPATGTVRVKADFPAGSDAPGLGTAVASRVDFALGSTISLPETALVTLDGKPAVWVVDPASGTVALMPVEVSDYTAGTIEVSGGLEEGAQVVTAGAHLLYPGKVVAAAGAAQ